MPDQNFRERMLSAIDDLKRTTERIENRIERVKDSMEKMNEKINSRLTAVEKDVTNLHGDVRWIRGKFEGRQEATSNQDAKTAFWIALGSALASTVSLVKFFGIIGIKGGLNGKTHTTCPCKAGNYYRHGWGEHGTGEKYD